MAKIKIEKLGSAKRFGARYGPKLKHNFAKIEKEQRKRHKCPYCSTVSVRRVAMGIWHCRKCNAKFTGKAYTITKAAPEENLIAETEDKFAEQMLEENTEEKLGAEEQFEEEKV